MSGTPLFRDRQAAGHHLATLILATKSAAIATGTWGDPVVYGLPRGGLPIAEVVAQALGCPLDIWVAKKITTPAHPELAIGAVTADGKVVYPHTGDRPASTDESWSAAVTAAYEKARQQAQCLAEYCPQVTPTGKVAIVIDDGIATGLTMLAALHAIQALHPRSLWVGVPVAPPEVVEFLGPWCDRLLVLEQPYPFVSVSRFYESFPQVSLDAVQIALIQQQRRLALGHAEDREWRGGAGG